MACVISYNTNSTATQTETIVWNMTEVANRAHSIISPYFPNWWKGGNDGLGALVLA